MISKKVKTKVELWAKTGTLISIFFGIAEPPLFSLLPPATFTQGLPFLSWRLDLCKLPFISLFLTLTFSFFW